MSIKLSDSIRVGQQKPLEDKYFNELVPYTSISQVNTLLPKAIRHRGLTVNINGEEYWYKDGIEDGDLVFKSNQKTIEVTKAELDVLISENKLEPNRLYKITGVESWCFSKHLIKAIYLKAITNNTLEIDGVGEFYTPKYNNSDSNLGIWKGELLANGMISSASYNIGDKVIWGNLFWENISGNIGTNIKEYYDSENDEYSSPELQNYLSETDWQLITPNDDESLYNIQFDSIKYDFQNDYINYRADNLGNVYEISYSTLLDFFPNNNIRDFVPEFIYNINSIALFQWGRGNTSNNIINESIVLNCNYTTTLFIFNTIVENSKMVDNIFFNVNIVRNNVKNSSISYNYLKSYGGLLYNNLDNSYISSNRYYFEIRNNTLKNISSIINNNDNNIIVNANYSIIKGNTLDNFSTITNNIFVEEGKGISGNLKGIYDNVLTTNCNIDNNTIKNGSRIYGHTMNYYSTINGNTLDTDSNIYHNQVIQGSKINNNILTGHGRIYGNQLNRTSEITLCKLRISPATGYATTMKNNRLFAGKIQNIDFGDIVNPVGTNPNDPAFGGNGLSECIIENESIIKDLTFPNHGGIGIQFVKMNGYSEFKNITVNNSIRNVDFINTIFNETSDYSKLIEGSGHQTNGFTKTYIDGVLLQDRFDEKQDILTEDNVGEFMDLELATKSTPSSGDTVLGRDSLTGKAVRIPTSSFGGGGSVDTSNLVPYTGATKNVNIGAYYFESSAGFKTPNGTANQALTANGGVFDLNTKADLVGGKVPSSQLPSYVDDVLEFANLASFPATGESGKIYIAIDTNITYRWGGSSYVVMSSSLALGETSSTAYRGDRGKIAYDHSQITHDKNLVGLGNVDNTSDLNKPISTATHQALNNKLDKGTYTGNASDLKSLIDTKADLVGGKVLASQSQPSTMVMDNSTYVITFTDATGAVQTIDLPLESLFKDANYDAQTKSLIVTLDNGTTKSIPLTDLVDLPEIVPSNTNPSVNPTTGQKVYFNTSLGKVWLNVSEAWVFAGNLISDSEKTNLSNAYTHSQTTGNPHGTTKADIGLGNVENTSDLNKPISTATQNELNLKLSTEVPSTTGTVISFSTDKVYGTLATPETGNVTADVTNAKLGVTNIIIHNSATAPTFGSQFKKLSGSGNYVAGVVNYIYCTFISTTEIIYSINQRA